MLDGGPLLPALWVSGELYLTTLAINIVAGVMIGLLLARSKLVSAAFEPYIYVLYATPTISLVPFVAVLFGFELWPRVIVGLPYIDLPDLDWSDGRRTIHPAPLSRCSGYFRLERASALARRDVRYVVPYAMTGIKQSIALAMAGKVVAEFFLNPDGLAAVMPQGTTIVDSAWVLAVTVFVAMIAVGLVGIGELIEWYLVRWRHWAVGYFCAIVYFCSARGHYGSVGSHASTLRRSLRGLQFSHSGNSTLVTICRISWHDRAESSWRSPRR